MPKTSTLAAKLKNKMALQANSDPTHRQHDITSWLKTKVGYSSGSEYSTTSEPNARGIQNSIGLDKTTTASAPLDQANSSSKLSQPDNLSTHPNGIMSDTEKATTPDISHSIKQSEDSTVVTTLPSKPVQDAPNKDKNTAISEPTVNKPPVQLDPQADVKQTDTTKSENVKVNEKSAHST